jgi:hypothetical protein
MAPARRARAKYSFYIFYTSPARRTSHYSGGPRNFDIVVISGTCGTFPCVRILLQDSQRTKGLGSVFGIMSPFLKSTGDIKSDSIHSS